MRTRQIACILIAATLFLSGPFALPVTYAIGSYKPSSFSQQSDTSSVTYYNSTAPMPLTGENASQPPRISIFASLDRGVSPLGVAFNVVFEPASGMSDVLVYEWDFEGDGVCDYVALGNGNVTRVYVVEKPEDLSPTLTIVFKSGETERRSLSLHVDPMRPEDWLEIRSLGTCMVGVMVNGSILLWDSHSLLPLSFAKHSVTLSNPSIKRYVGASRLTYSSEKTKLDVTLEYGVSGRVFFNFTEYSPTHEGQSDVGVGLKLPTEYTVVTLTVGLAAPALPALEQTFSYGSPAITSVLRTASRDYLDLNERSATAADYAWSLAMGYCNYGINREVTTEIMRNIIIDDLENQLSIRIIGSLTTATWSTPLYPPLKNAISSRIDQYWLDDSIDNGYPCDYVPNRDLE